MSIKLVKNKTAREERIDHFQYLWEHESHQFDNQKCCREQLRLERTWEAIKTIPHLDESNIIDLGCGKGEICIKLNEMGAQVTALDISSIPLMLLKKEEIQTIQDVLPRTRLGDDLYDVVICTDVIGHLPQNEHRLLFLEISRLVKRDGYVVFSTSLDINSADPLETLKQLAETEFDIQEWILSYHAMHIKLGMNNRVLLKPLETITRFFYQEDGISHALFIAKRKPLF